MGNSGETNENKCWQNPSDTSASLNYFRTPYIPTANGMSCPDLNYLLPSLPLISYKCLMDNTTAFSEINLEKQRFLNKTLVIA